jgi:hypothetical protein
VASSPATFSAQEWIGAKVVSIRRFAVVSAASSRAKRHPKPTRTAKDSWESHRDRADEAAGPERRNMVRKVPWAGRDCKPIAGLGATKKAAGMDPAARGIGACYLISNICRARLMAVVRRR